VTAVQEIVFKLVERSRPRAGKERDECALCDAETFEQECNSRQITKRSYEEVLKLASW